MHAASIWIDPSARLRDPTPALKRPSFSSTSTAAQAASTAVNPPCISSRPRSQARSVPSEFALSEPAPPWASRANW
ncbi:hypothetical protein LQ236_000762 [Nitrospina gracilis]|nr:hypothetical protein [Nitrospina sp. Nb-3]